MSAEEAHRRRLRTRLGDLRDPNGRPPLRSLFVLHYEWMRERFEKQDLGVAMVAVHMRGQLAEAAWVAARPDRAIAVIIGRHPRVDLALPDEGISLRHLVAIVHPNRSWSPSDVRVQLHDLRTESGFWGENDEQLSGVMAEGAVILWCGDYALFVLPTGDPSDWPSNAATAWSFLPERVYLSDRPAVRSVAPPKRDSPTLRGRAHTVVTMLRPLMSVAECGAGHRIDTLGTLNCSSSEGSVRLAISRAAAKRGLLLGSYERCDEHAVLGSAKISRVHLLLLLAEGVLYAIDTASTNRTIVNRKALLRNAHPLTGETLLELANGAATVLWTPT